MKTTIDWAGFRTKSDPFAILEALKPAFGTCADMLTMVASDKGRDGWLFGKDLMMVDIRLGTIDYGGDAQRDWVRVNLTGTGCEWVQDWLAFRGLGDTLKNAEVRRVDIALTTYKGEVTDSMVVKANDEGRFTTSGRAPDMRSIVSSNPRAGKTRYIGSRAKSDKMLRCYEKGFEMIKDLPEVERNKITKIGEDLVEQIYRVELELKAVTKYLPWFIFTERDLVFAGAYPFCADLLPGVPHRSMQTLPDFKPRSDLQAMLANCKASYGPTIFTAMAYYNGDAAKVLAMIMGTDHARCLVDSGVLTLDQAVDRVGF
jgi:DNA relaxase NicK